MRLGTDRRYYGLEPLDGARLSTGSVITPMAARQPLPMLASVTSEHPTQRVEVSFVGAPPVRRIELSSGVSEVEIDGPVVRCLVAGSFQPFLEALRGHEVVNLRSTPATDATSSTRAEGGHR